MLKKDWSNHSLIILLPFLCVVIIYATEAFTRYSFFECRSGNCSESIPKNIWKVFESDSAIGESPAADSADERQLLALRYSGRITWFFLSEIFLYVCIGTLVIASFLSTRVHQQPRIILSLGILIPAGMVGLFFHANPQLHMAIFLTLFENAITPDVPTIARNINFLNSLGNAALFSLLLASCILLRPVQNESLPESLKELSMKTKDMSIILYTGTALLVTAIMLKDAIYQWSLAYTAQDSSIEIARDFITSLLAWEGGFYTLVLAAAYLPAMLVLQRRAQLLMGPAVSETEKEIKFKELGMNFSLKESLPHILAILGPFLTGPVGDLLTGTFF